MLLFSLQEILQREQAQSLYEKQKLFGWTFKT
ncbi:MAG: hypothetical protein UT48_C0001G0012 [Parcubacteria group bacterium GW2011_GWE2_39_37]|uniref:Uncharacterized protein n=1 Tax=Candidatus Falkowbacteria bacterium GW2011_GWF2_39_8 TaxID=1618642 RepID=A0A0G0Q7C2_9BACT|nr:MAG: hypothetical protein UT48_C0001G0012 [Parcubacteria group bacterium GW2011_GWE2_39_37]KKR33211.1 MAG: hypothetical protein UT64_C0012G0003 [Candidatus Falkowbacteria bacterium GW2011_GWF2_39_8]